MSETEPTSEPSDAANAHSEETQPARRPRATRKRKAPAQDAATAAPPETEAADANPDEARADEPVPDAVPDSAILASNESGASSESVASGDDAGGPDAGPEAVSDSAVEAPADQGASAEESAGEPADDDSEEPALPVIPDHEIDRAVEALLFASSEPLTPQRVAAVLCVTQRRVKTALDRLREEYAANQRAFDIREIAGGLRLYTRSEFDDIVARLEKVKPPEKLSASALESLAIVAYRQPITRAEIDSIRGVQSGALLKSLTDRKLIRVVGRSEQPGRPLQYGTTKRFLDHFGLASIEDLPRVEDLKAP